MVLPMVNDEKSSAQKVAQRRDNALRRALNMKPKPKTKKVKGDGSKASLKPPRKVAHEA